MAIRVTRPLRVALGITLGGALLGGAGLYASPTLTHAFGGSDAPAKKAAEAGAAAAPGVQVQPVAFRRDDIANYDAVDIAAPPQENVDEALAQQAVDPSATETPGTPEPSLEPPVEPTPPVSPSPPPVDPTLSEPPVDPTLSEPPLEPSGDPAATPGAPGTIPDDPGATPGDPAATPGGPAVPGDPGATPSDEPVPSDGPVPSDEPVPSDGPVPSEDPATDPSGEPTPPVSPSASEPAVTPSTEPTPSESPSTPDASPSASSSVTPSQPEPSVTSASPGTTTKPNNPPPGTPADKTAPTGTYRVSAGAVWIGQTVTVTQAALADNVSKPAQIERTVTFGDGTPARRLKPGETKFAKVYGRAGRFKLTVTLRDAARNTRTVTVATVTVTRPAARFKLNKSAVWHGERYTLAISAVPRGTTKIVIDYSDGWVSNLSGRNQTIAASFTVDPSRRVVKPGVKQLRATFFDKNGRSAAFVAAKLTLKRDSWNPKVSLTKPKNPNRVSSWKAVRGTASDKGSGVASVTLSILQIRGNTLHCYTKKSAWKKISFDDLEEHPDDPDRFLRVCPPLVTKVTKGKWSLPLKKMARGELFVGYASTDWAGRDSSVEGQAIQQKINRA